MDDGGFIWIYGGEKVVTWISWILLLQVDLCEVSSPGGGRFELEAEQDQGGDTFILGKHSSIPGGGHF